jgi:transposase InsO family protein
MFRCESVTLRTHWVLVVMDQFTRRIIGFGVYRGIVDGLALCRMFQQAIRRQSLPKYLGTDNDPLYLVLALHGRFHAHSTRCCALFPLPKFRRGVAFGIDLIFKDGSCRV